MSIQVKNEKNEYNFMFGDMIFMFCFSLCFYVDVLMGNPMVTRDPMGTGLGTKLNPSRIMGF
jgi:hypothetical protein